jgi:methionine biosynthesis protein MetW
MQDSEAVRGLTAATVDALRYDGKSTTPHESSGLLMSMIPEGARVLDIGCGTGSITSMIRDLRRADVVGIEPNPARAKRAEETGLTVINGFYTEDVPVKYGKFDLIIFADVLEHLENPVDILEQAKAALSDCGKVLASIPNVAHWTIRARLLAGQFDYKPTGIMDATHLRWFTRKGVRLLFDSAGYNIERFHSAAGAWIGAYRLTPLGLLSYETRSFVLSKFCAAAPGLFAVQHVISARPK